MTRPPAGGPRRPRERLLTQNGELRRTGVHDEHGHRLRLWNWTLPAWAGRLPDGRTYNTCPSAGVCAQVCYARNGTYLFPAVVAKHQRNLTRVLDDLDRWGGDMVAELRGRRFRGGSFVRVHDAGDFFTDDYLQAWMTIAALVPDVVFYAYTKEVARFRRLAEGHAPGNFLWVYSYGGRQDAALDPGRDRVADVFPTGAALVAAGYTNQEESDLLAVLGPRRVGIVVNNIPQFRKRQGPRSFAEWQQSVDAEQASRRAARSPGRGPAPRAAAGPG